MFSDRVSKLWTFGLGAALLLGMEFVPFTGMAQTPSSSPPIKQARPTREPNTVGFITGSPEEGALPYVNDIARALASGQETGPNGELALRVLPIGGRGGVHDIRDVLSFPGVDMALTQEHVLSRLQDSREFGGSKSNLVYVAKLFIQELHVIARNDIKQFSELAEQPVNFGESGSSSDIMARDLFNALGLKVSEVHMRPEQVLEEMRQGRVAATVLLALKPAAFVERLTRDGGFHLISIPFPSAATLYLPASLRHEDYPTLVPAGARIDTVAVRTVLVGYNWPERSQRYQLLADFVEAFFSRFSELEAAAQHSKWQEIDLAATLPGWKRFRPAERWLQISQAQQTGSASTRTISQSGVSRRELSKSDAETERLFKEFLRWREQRGRR